jgi:hypothetical protein
LCRPTLGGEIGRDLAKVLLRKAFGDGRHDWVVAFAISSLARALAVGIGICGLFLTGLITAIAVYAMRTAIAERENG